MAENGIQLDIIEVIKKALSENFEHADIILNEDNANEVNQLLATVKTNKGDLNVEVKYGEGENVTEGFKREAYVLKEVIPLFFDLQKYLRIQNPVAAFQKCYKVFNNNGIDVIILEDLEAKGYNKAPSDLNEHNYKLILKAIAKFHGLSFALRHIHPEKFDEVLSNCHVVTRSMLEEIAQFFDSRLEKLKFNLKLRGRLDLLGTFEEALEEFNGSSIIKILNDKVESSVLVHGDYHHNNVLLKYEGDNQENAVDVGLTGFQASGLHSPVIDLSHYFFSSLGNGVFNSVPDFLKFYYEELSVFLKQLGCEAEEIYPYEKLLDHWHKYSFYGFCFTVAFLELGSLNFDKGKPDTKKEEQEIAAALQKTYKNRKIDNAGQYRKKLEKIVEGFLDSKMHF